MNYQQCEDDMINRKLFATATPSYSIVLDTHAYTARNGERMRVDVIAVHEQTLTRSVVCSLNGLSTAVPAWVQVYDMSNNWNIPAGRIMELVAWFCSLDKSQLEAWFEYDRSTGEWSAIVDEHQTNVDDFQILRGG